MTVTISEMHTEVVPDASSGRPPAPTPPTAAVTVELWREAQQRDDRCRRRTSAYDFED